MSFIIKKVGRESYLQKRGKSSVSEDDLWFISDKEQAMKFMFYYEAFSASRDIFDKWEIENVMVEV